MTVEGLSLCREFKKRGIETIEDMVRGPQNYTPSRGRKIISI